MMGPEMLPYGPVELLLSLSTLFSLTPPFLLRMQNTISTTMRINANAPPMAPAMMDIFSGPAPAGAVDVVPADVAACVADTALASVVVAVAVAVAVVVVLAPGIFDWSTSLVQPLPEQLYPNGQHRFPQTGSLTLVTVVFMGALGNLAASCSARSHVIGWILAHALPSGQQRTVELPASARHLLDVGQQKGRPSQAERPLAQVERACALDMSIGNPANENTGHRETGGG